ncbi:MAG TPA: cation transporter [Candidatus Acidoferrales bacterium]|nr:cation transporter [Candidatus Acidoferrales bacterium]
MAGRTAASRSGVRIEAFTVAWMAVEAAVAVGAGLAARSVLLTAFGLDSVIELLSAGALLWRLQVEAAGGDQQRVVAAERRVVRVSAVLLVLLCAYVVVTAALGLVLRVQPEGSVLGLVVAAAAVVVMPLLAWRKRGVNRTLESAALRADIVETLTCAYLAGATLVGVGLNLVLHWWWAEYLCALALLWWLAREAWETVQAARD